MDKDLKLNFDSKPLLCLEFGCLIDFKNEGISDTFEISIFSGNLPLVSQSCNCMIYFLSILSSSIMICCVGDPQFELYSYNVFDVVGIYSSLNLFDINLLIMQVLPVCASPINTNFNKTCLDG